MNSGVFKLARLSWRYLWSRPLAAVLNLLVLTLGLAAITLVLLVATQLDKAFERDLSGIDLVVGAKGSPLQLILAGVFHIDVPTGNIPLQEVQALLRILERSVAAGLHHIETARHYGSSERQLGDLLARVPDPARILQTKIPPTADPAQFEQELLTSLPASTWG